MMASECDADIDILRDIDKLSEVLSDRVVPEATVRCDSVAEYSPSRYSCVELPAFSPPAHHSSAGYEPASRRSAPHVDTSLSQDTEFCGDLIQSDIPANLENCLALNKAYQEVLEENLSGLLQHLAGNRRRRQELQDELSQLQNGGSCGSSPATPRPVSWGMFLTRYFSGGNAFGPSLHKDSMEKFANKEYVNLRQSRFWTHSDRNTLHKAVLEDAKRQKQQMPRSKLELVDGKMTAARAQIPPDRLQLEALQQLRGELQRDIAAVNELPVVELVGERDHEFDWHSIALGHFEGTREPEECSRQWKNWMHPSISHDAWSEREDDLIKRCVDRQVKCGGRQPSALVWQDISRQLSPWRSPLQVFRRWTIGLVDATQSGVWNVEDTKRLLNTIDRVKMNTFVCWRVVSFHMETRTPQQCRGRYYQLNPNLVRGRFSRSEDTALLAGVEALRMDFAAIGQVLTDRSKVQLRKRYLERLSPQVNLQPWSRQEEERLVQLVWHLGAQWREVTTALGGGRTPNDCRSRFDTIRRYYRSKGSLPQVGLLVNKAFHGNLNYVTDLREKAEGDIKRMREQHPELDCNSLLKKYCTCLGLVESSMPARRKFPVKLGMKRSKRAVSGRAASVARAMFARPPCQSGPRRTLISPEAVCLTQLYCSGLGLNADAVSHSLAAADLQQLRRRVPDRQLQLLGMFESSVLSLPGSCAASRLLSDLRCSKDAPPSSPSFTRPALAWPDLPLLPPTRTSLAMFRSLLLLRSELESQAVGVPGKPFSGRPSACSMTATFNRLMSDWAGSVMSCGATARPSTHARHRDHLAQVDVFQKPPGSSEARAIRILLPIDDTRDPQHLLKILAGMIPYIVQVTVSRAPDASLSTADVPPPRPQQPAGDCGSEQVAWRTLLARFVSLFFWPALLSFTTSPACRPPLPEDSFPSHTGNSGLHDALGQHDGSGDYDSGDEPPDTKNSDIPSDTASGDEPSDTGSGNAKKRNTKRSRAATSKSARKRRRT